MAAYVQDAIVLLGDSLTQGANAPYGFSQQLAYTYNRQLDVINRGFGGYNTAWAIPVFEQCLTKRDQRQNAPKVRLLTIWFGANDACLPGFRQHVPLDLFSENLTKLIHMVSSAKSEYYSPETRVILLTPPPVNTNQRGNDRDFETTSKYADAVREVGKKENVPIVDVWTLLWEGCGKVEGNLTKYLTDGLHVNAEAYEVPIVPHYCMLRDIEQVV
ncbi:hypothetical protein PHLCEN_2v3012 [Hermanssonia centrifuga]|uniref:SGNH hydrolase-type esterase domain-containing protein n=1 Tax=Hermanssonia centrifuga TaxID=98765 RepID=A0A2R6R7B2_9APHY|nr:hypothetical protein PHLCEN_2v3012 [Hermanssonia centrifuga]